MNEINKLWEDFKSKPFPKGIAGEEIDGIEPAEIDTYAAGCISTYIEGGIIDKERIEILKNCLSSIQTILPKLNDEGKSYFSMLNKLGGVVLKEVDNDS